jgi:transposase
MAMGRKRARQQALWVATEQLAQSGGHAFYEHVNEILNAHQLDAFVEAECVGFYKSEVMGRPSIAPSVYFRMLMVGYFEGLNLERGIAWRCADFVEPEKLPGIRSDPEDAGSFNGIPNPAIDRWRDAWSSI